jgi:hypothetical protein
MKSSNRRGQPAASIGAIVANGMTDHPTFALTFYSK